MGFFSKNSRWNVIFLVLSWKMILLFPENMILSLGRKKKDNLSQKKYTEIWWNFLQTFWKDGLFKKGHAETWSFLYYLERWDFFHEDMVLFLGLKVRDDLSQKVHVNMVSSVYTYGCYKRGATPLCRKKLNMVLSRRIHLKVTDVLDWHSRKSSSNSLYFHGDLYRRFCVLLSSEKKQET